MRGGRSMSTWKSRPGNLQISRRDLSAKIALLEKKGSYFIHSAQDEVVGDPVFAHLVSWVFGNYPQKGEDYHKLVPILQVSAAT